MSVDLRSLKRLERAFSRARREVALGSSALAKRIEKGMGGLDAKQNVQVFKREVDPETGRNWVPLSPGYAKWKRENSKSKKKLVLTGDMKKSLTTASHASRVVRLSGMTITLGTKSRKAAKHMTGGTFTETVPAQLVRSSARSGAHTRHAHTRKFKIPARPMVGKTPRQLRAQGAVVRKQVQDRLGTILGGPAGLELKRTAQRIKPDPRRF